MPGVENSTIKVPNFGFFERESALSVVVGIKPTPPSFIILVDAIFCFSERSYLLLAWQAATA
jgi:hypothetical protein